MSSVVYQWRIYKKERPKIFGLPRPLSVTLEVQTEYLEATLGLAKRLEISKELCNCAWLLLLHATAV